MQYTDFLKSKLHTGALSGEGIDLGEINPLLYPFQRFLTNWAILKGRCALFCDCGLGKTPMQLAWAEYITRRENKPVLILTPLAVSAQTIREGEKFGIECHRSVNGTISKGINISNYERLHLFDSKDFVAVVCDESSILKNFNGVRKAAITEFMRQVPYRLLCTATAAPNDYIELGTSSEALGELGYMDMLNRFFTNKMRTSYGYHGKWRLDDKYEWRFKGHAAQPFWRWMASWARACRKPSDLGFLDDGFDLPNLVEREIVVQAKLARPGMLFDIEAVGLREERELRRRTVKERCEIAAARVADTNEPAVIWCHLNVEGDALAKLIDDAEQVSGKDSDESKEAKFEAFCSGQIRVLIIKPVIGAFGLNWQHCSHVVYFADHSYERYYQAVRRCWRFGQMRPVTVDVIRTEAESRVMANLRRKTEAANEMFNDLVAQMNESLTISLNGYHQQMEAPSWL